MTTKQPRGHELRNCYHCGGPVKVYNSDARNGAGKYCSRDCSDIARSRWEAIAAQLPATTIDISLALGVSQEVVAHALALMADRGMAHASGIVHREAKGKPGVALLYAAGKNPDRKAPKKFNEALGYYLDKMILAAMPNSKARIIAKTGLSYTTVTKRLLDMRKHVDENGVRAKTFICDYERLTDSKRGTFVQVHQRGPGVDQPCTLAPKTHQEKYLSYRDKAAEKRQRRQAERRQMEIGDPLLNAFFGSPADRRKQDRRQEG